MYRGTFEVHGHFFLKTFTGILEIHGLFFDGSRALLRFTGTFSYLYSRAQAKYSRHFFENVHGHFFEVHGAKKKNTDSRYVQRVPVTNFKKDPVRFKNGCENSQNSDVMDTLLYQGKKR